MPIIVTPAIIILAAFVSTRTGSADAFIAVLVVAPLAALGLFYVLLLVGWIIRAIRSGSNPR
jgi:small neutral amino acid transporter SnatA (MarC family)